MVVDADPAEFACMNRLK